jgi:hypothetical protein
MSKQKFLHSNIETAVSTLASCLIFVGFGFDWHYVLGLTATMYLKNIGIRLIFDRWVK